MDPAQLLRRRSERSMQQMCMRIYNKRRRVTEQPMYEVLRIGNRIILIKFVSVFLCVFTSVGILCVQIEISVRGTICLSFRLSVSLCFSVSLSISLSSLSVSLPFCLSVYTCLSLLPVNVNKHFDIMQCTPS